MRMRSLRRPAADLAQAVHQLPVISAGLEQTYLNLEGKLEHLADIATRLVGELRGLAEIAGSGPELDGGFERMRRVLQGPLEFLRTAVDGIPQNEQDCSAACAAVAEAVALESELVHKLLPLRFMHILFRVESARLPAEAREVFVTLAADIGALYERVRESYEGQLQVLREAGRALRGASESAERHWKEYAQELAERRGELDASLARMDREMGENAGRNARIQDAGAEFASAVQGAMLAMQTQDIVAQKLEHAGSGLRDALEAVELAHSGAKAAPRIATLARIEMGQLDAVAAELDQSGETLAEAARKVAARLDDDGALVGSAGSALVGESRRFAQTMDCVAQALAQNLDALRAMTAQTLEMARLHQRMLVPAREALGALTVSVDGAARDMQRIALNAQIRSVQLGRETGLEVLASRTAEIAGEVLAISADLNAGLARSEGKLQGSIARMSELCAAGERVLQFCDKTAAAEVCGLKVTGDRALAAACNADELVQQAGSAVRDLLAGIDLSSSREALARVRRAVEALAESAEQMSGSGSPVDALAVESRYTMHSERQVHHRVLRELAVEAAGPDETGVSAAAAQAGANIELF
jgi:hypothetical protein